MLVPHRILLLSSLLLVSHVKADWRTEAGYPELVAELGGVLPTGAGIVALRVEAPEGVNYLPISMAVTPTVQGGKTYHALSALGNGSGHAVAVGGVFYGAAGISNGVATIHCDEALNFVTDLNSGVTPPSFLGDVQNFSWVGSSADATDLLRRFDFMINRDRKIAVVAPSNDTGPVAQLMTSSHHAICAGVFSGVHNRGGTVVDGTGRMKPDVVVDQPFTSLAAPSVASASALLMEKIMASFPTADQPQVVKSLIIAGASKKRLPGWFRADSSKPYDEVFGAGELNVLNAYHILVAGQQTASSTVERGRRGWDYGSASSSTARRYFFSIPNGQMANLFSVSLVWHRRISNFTFSPTLPNLNLRLFASTSFTPAAQPIGQSLSGVDNVEHLFLRNLPPGQYMLEVTSNINNHSYAIAWESQLGPGPTLSIRRNPAGGVFLDLANLDPFVSYVIEQSSTLAPLSWTTAATIRKADTSPSTTHTWQDVSVLPDSRFYRLLWAPVR
jgi:hypothetical protein